MLLFNETPGMGILRNVLYAVAIAMLYSLYKLIDGTFNAGFLPAYGIVGICLSFFGWGGERLWYATFLNFFSHPFAWYVVPTHIPLWGMLGGIGYTIAILTSTKLGIYQAELIPVKNIFFTGAWLGCCIQTILYILDRKLKRLPKPNRNT